MPRPAVPAVNAVEAGQMLGRADVESDVNLEVFFAYVKLENMKYLKSESLVSWPIAASSISAIR